MKNNFEKEYIDIAVKEVLAKELANNCVYLKEKGKDLLPIYLINNMELTLIKFGVLLNQYLGLIECDDMEDAKNYPITSSDLNLMKLYDNYKGEIFIEKIKSDKKYKNTVIDWTDFCNKIDFYVNQILQDKNGLDTERFARVLEIKTNPEVMQENFDLINEIFSKNFESKATVSDEEFCKENNLDLEEFKKKREQRKEVLKNATTTIDTK